MLKISLTGKFVLRFLLAMMLWSGSVHTGYAQNLADPAQVVDQYLASLINGDTQQMLAVIDGRMLRKNGQLVNASATYPQFLRNIYAGVQTTVEDIAAVGDKTHIRVRFDYPAPETSEIIFVLSNKNNEWKITDELY